MVKTFSLDSGCLNLTCSPWRPPLHAIPEHGTLYRVLTPELPTNLEIIESIEPDGVRLTVSGELDVAVTGRMQDRLDSVARAGETVVLDLSSLSFIDSSGLNVLVTAFRRSRQEGWELRIERTLSPAVHRVVTMMGLDAVFWGQL